MVKEKASNTGDVADGSQLMMKGIVLFFGVASFWGVLLLGGNVLEIGRCRLREFDNKFTLLASLSQYWVLMYVSICGINVLNSVFRETSSVERGHSNDRFT